MFSKQVKEKPAALMFRIGVAMLVMLFVVVLGPLNIGTGHALTRGGQDYRGGNSRDHEADACAQTSEAASKACESAAEEDYNLALGKCENVAKSEQVDCKAEADEDFDSALKECDGQFDARQEVCDEIGQGPYLPDGIEPSDFKKYPHGNNYFPLDPGSKYTYQSIDSEENIQTIVVTAKNITTIDGVTCRVVTDKVYEGKGTSGHLLEDTIDWFAQDDKGNVWYFGETTIAFEYDDFDNPTASTEGSWMSGMDGAKPGFIMLAEPKTKIGKLYRQEFALGTAEDLGKVIEILTYDQFKDKVLGGNNVPTVFGNGPFLHTEDSTPLEPDLIEDKYYSKDVGLVLTVEPEATEVLIKIK
jgi:hypothetical protein